MITIVGLGAGDLEQLPLGVYRLLQNAKQVYLRTEAHPVVQALAKEGLCYTSFDAVYEKHDTFDAVYEAITQTLLEANEKCDIVYAVPGHPMVAERVVQLLLEAPCEVKIAGGKSFLDDTFSRLKIDPIEGFLLLDATDVTHMKHALNQHTVFAQVYDTSVASEVKLSLLEVLPHDYAVFVITAVGSDNEAVTEVALSELDHVPLFTNLTSLYVPPVPEALRRHEVAVLREVVATLRGPNGCPWDQVQTHQTLKKNLIEETNELLEALDEADEAHVVEELGDVLLQVVLHAQIGEESGFFNFDDVVRNLNEKLIRRHPHVFGDVKAHTPEEAIEVWKQMKEREKNEEAQHET